MNDSADFDFRDLLHPAQAFGHPSEVLNDPDLTTYEKRSILASWASDACAIEAAPELRSSPRGTLVRFDEIMDALRELDRQVEKVEGPAFYGRAPCDQPKNLRGETPPEGNKSLSARPFEGRDSRLC